MKKRGITFVEVMIASLLSAMIAGSIASALAITVRQQTEYGRARLDYENKTYFEDRIRTFLSHCWFSTEDPDTTYFRGDSTTGDSSSADRVTFTMCGLRTNGNATTSDNQDFSDRNDKFGPVGGTTEVSLATVPVGEAGDRQGLFVRKQTPADADYTQGGYESLLDPDIASILFEFYDGTAWISTWDTQVDQRLPSAVRVTYTLTSDPDIERSFVVKILQAAPEPAQQGVQNP